MCRAILTTAVLFLGISATAEAQVKLQWKFGENAKATVTVASKTHQVLKIGEMDIETGNEETVVSKTSTGKRKEDGTLQQTSKVDSLKVKLTLPGGIDLAFDSAKPAEPQGTAADFLLDLFAAIPKVVSTTVYGKDNRVVSVKVDESPFKDLPDQAKAILKGRFDADYLKEAANKQLDRIPSKPVKKGDTWQVTLAARLGQGQTLTFKTNYKYEGTIEKDGKTLDKISFEAIDVKYTQDAPPNSPIKVTDSDVQVESSEGTLLFDRELGQIVEETDKLRVTGDLTLDANGQEIPAKFDLTIEKKATVKVE